MKHLSIILLLFLLCCCGNSSVAVKAFPEKTLRTCITLAPDTLLYSPEEEMLFKAFVINDTCIITSYGNNREHAVDLLDLHSGNALKHIVRYGINDGEVLAAQTTVFRHRTQPLLLYIS